MMTNLHQARIHAQTLAELNHCVGTARRDAAFKCLLALAMREQWPESRVERNEIYASSLKLSQEVSDITERSSLIFSNPRQGIMDRSVLHFMRMLHQLLQSIQSMTEHIENVQAEAEVLAEHLGEQTYNMLLDASKGLEEHEVVMRNALQRILLVGQNLLESNTARRRQDFSEDDNRRYQKAYEEYLQHYSGNGG